MHYKHLLLALAVVSAPVAAELGPGEIEPRPPGAYPQASARAEYMETMEALMSAWAERIQNYVEQVLERKPGGGGSDNRALTDAWTRTQQDWRALQAAPPERWDWAREEFRESLRLLNYAWEQAVADTGRGR